MTIVDTAPLPPPAPSSPPSAPRRGRVLGAVTGVLVLALAGAALAANMYYDSIPEAPEIRDNQAVVRVRDVPAPVLNTFVAAVDPDFYAGGDWPWSSSLITQRYVIVAAEDFEAPALRTAVMASKLEDKYMMTDILGFYLSTADFGRGVTGLDAAAQAHFRKPATALTVAEAARLAVLLDPDAPADPRAAWDRVLGTMVERGWLSQAERDALRYPA
ncbi:transglycosylase domain-containing protein [Catellatospora sp. NPDC049609]|uniref:transglycosylase domain-containing protein n=1 Tax=Catellatospora sp. NPDC049609 TaxID=3155505 RepID=UPI00342412CB